MKIRHRFAVLSLAFAATSFVADAPNQCHAQSAVLSEVYGRGVHAYHAGNYQRAHELLSVAINNNIQDPRAYYFRGIAAEASGRSYESGTDFQIGAELEARGTFGNAIGRSLVRIQGSTRLKLEQAREKARLQALALGRTRSKTRLNELGVSPAGNIAPPTVVGSGRVVVPPPQPGGDDPFAEQPVENAKVESTDAFEDAMKKPMAGEADDTPMTDEPGDSIDPFGGDGSGDVDPFGGPADEVDPFGGPDTGAEDDPFGSDAGDPFGDDPFGN